MILSGLNQLVIQIDGIHIDQDLMLVVTVGVDGYGDKHPLGVMEGGARTRLSVRPCSTTWSAAALIPPSVVCSTSIDGLRALSKAICNCFGRSAPIQRCQVGLLNNVTFAVPILSSCPGRRSWPLSGTAGDIAEDLSAETWRRLSAGVGTKGERFHDWAYLELADLDASDYDDAFTGIWTRGLLIRGNVTDGDLAFFTTWCPQGTPIETLVWVEGHRWAIEDSFETAKNGFGLDHNETRSWHGWHRHVSLVMLAFAMMVTIRHHANAAPPPKTMRRTRH